MSCSSIRVFADHDSSVDFSNYSSYAFFKPGIEEVEISDLDKRRILKAIEQQMETKGMQLSSAPDILINIAVKATDRVVVNNNNLGWGWGWGWNPWFWGVITTLFLHKLEENCSLILLMLKQNFWYGKAKVTGVSTSTVRIEMSAFRHLSQKSLRIIHLKKRRVVLIFLNFKVKS